MSEFVGEAGGGKGVPVSCHLSWKLSQMMTAKVMKLFTWPSQYPFAVVHRFETTRSRHRWALEYRLIFDVISFFSCFSRLLPTFFDWRCWARVFRLSATHRETEIEGWSNVNWTKRCCQLHTKSRLLKLTRPRKWWNKLLVLLQHYLQDRRDSLVESHCYRHWSYHSDC